MILLADDDEDVRVYVKTFLEMSGHKVIEALDGEDAIRKFRAHSSQIRLLILDVIMPGKTGSEAYEEIKKLRPGIKALFISGYTDDAVSKNTGEAIVFVRKPFRAQELLRNIETVTK